MQITLTPDIENALIKYAKHQGLTPEVLALGVLRERFISPTATEISAKEKETLADYLAGHLGVLSSGEHIPGGAEMSKNSGRKFAAGLLKKRRQGRL